MITKAIVEEVISPYQVKVRIPILDRAKESPLSTNIDSLNTATICSLPNCYINVQVGDVVFVGFEDNTYYKAIILGHLSRAAMSNTYADVTFNDLVVRDGAVLPATTSVGTVTSTELSYLSGLRGNIQKQLDLLQNQIDFISTQLEGGTK